MASEKGDFADINLWFSKNMENPHGGIYVNANDLFWWACADAVELTPENFASFNRAHRDAAEAGDASWGAVLFCCRENGMRPQGAFYPPPEPEFWAIRKLLDECGPEREIDIGNPKDTNGVYLYRE